MKNRVNTKFGPVEVKPTDGKHVYVQFGGHYTDAPSMSVRGVEYNGSVHFYLYENGEFHIGDEFYTPSHPNGEKRLANAYDKRSALHLYRTDWVQRGSYAKSEPSEAARKTIAEALEAAVGEWLKSDAGKEALGVAEAEDHQKKIEKAAEELAEAEKVVACAKEKLERLLEVA
jgi:hypothetical protein